jgi:catechol 2,3-dioxygenase-like lactoylglutathione lyase family enzyme
VPKIERVLETALYVSDMPRAVAFFESVLGLSQMVTGDRLTAFDAGHHGVLLVFQKGASTSDIVGSGGTVPGHDGSGPIHMAFAIAADSYDDWKAHLINHGVAIRSEVSWTRGGRSIYFEDPDGHVLELATPGLWPNY